MPLPDPGGTADAAGLRDQLIRGRWPVLERPGTSLLPGLIDAHTHVLLRSSYDEFGLARQMAEENLGHRADGLGATA